MEQRLQRVYNLCSKKNNFEIIKIPVSCILEELFSYMHMFIKVKLMFGHVYKCAVCVHSMCALAYMGVNACAGVLAPLCTCGKEQDRDDLSFWIPFTLFIKARPC